jgi:hypothetical protein
LKIVIDIGEGDKEVRDVLRFFVEEVDVV